MREEIEGKNSVLYKKVGRRYVEFDSYYDDRGLNEGLWLITKNRYSRGCTNMLYPMLTHQLTNVGKFADYYKAHEEKLIKKIIEEMENTIVLEKGYSVSDLAHCVIAAISKIED